MALKNCLVLALAVLARSLFGGTVVGEGFYWTNGGGDGKWTTLANWTSDADGKVAATRYPGSDPSKDNDAAYLGAHATGTITVDEPVTLHMISFLAGCDVTLTGERVTVTSTKDSSGKRTDVLSGASVTLKDIEFKLVLLTAVGSLVVDDGATVILDATSRDAVLRRYNNSDVFEFKPRSKFIVEKSGKYDGSVILQPNGSNPKAGVLQISGGTFIGGRIFLNTVASFPDVTDITLSYSGGDVQSKIVAGSDEACGGRIVVAAGAELVASTVELHGGTIANEPGGVLTVTNALDISTAPATILPPDVAGEHKVLRLGKGLGSYADYDLRVQGASDAVRVRSEMTDDGENLYLENLLPSKFSADTGFVVQTAGSEGDRDETNNPFTNKNCWANGEVCQPGTNYYTAKGMFFDKSSTFDGRSFTQASKMRINENKKTISVGDWRVLPGAEVYCSDGTAGRTQTLEGSITVLSTAEQPFVIRPGLDGNTMAVNAALIGGEERALELNKYVNPKADPPKQNWVNLRGDASRYYGLVDVTSNVTLRLGAITLNGEVRMSDESCGLETMGAGVAVLSKLTTRIDTSLQTLAGDTLVASNALSVTGVLTKGGAGTLVIGGAGTAGEGAALRVDEGSVRFVSASALGPVPLVLAEGTELVLDWNPSDAVLAEKGVDLSGAAFAPTSSVRVRFDCGGTAIEKKTYRKAIATVRAEDADGIAFDIAKPAKGIRATEVERVPSEDGATVTFLAVFDPVGMAILLK